MVLNRKTHEELSYSKYFQNKSNIQGCQKRFNETFREHNLLARKQTGKTKTIRRGAGRETSLTARTVLAQLRDP